MKDIHKKNTQSKQTTNELEIVLLKCQPQLINIREH